MTLILVVVGFFPFNLFVLSFIFFRNCTESTKDAIAAALRHSRAESQRTYDRRTANQKKAPALSFARRHADQALGESAVGEDFPHFPVSQFVGVVQGDSTARRPHVFIGQLMYYSGSEAHLLWYKAMPSKRNTYSLCLDGSPWVESAASLVAVEMKPGARHGEYKLHTPLKRVHDQGFENKKD